MKLPEITYPLNIDTIGMVLATGHEVTLSCNTLGCHHTQRLNLVRLARRHGMNHGASDGALKPHVWCVRCREAGRPDRNIGFTFNPPTKASAWPRRERGGARAGD